MKFIRVLAIVAIGCLISHHVASAQTAAGVDPIIGSWKLVPSRSHVLKGVRPSAPPVAQIETYRLSEDKIEITIQATAADGTSSLRRLVWPASGGAVTRLQGDTPSGQTLIETWCGSGEWRVTYMQDGKQFRTRQKIVANDGKTMRQIVRATDSQGNAFEELQFFERR